MLVTTPQAAWCDGYKATMAELTRRAEAAAGRRTIEGSEAIPEETFAMACYMDNSMDSLSIYTVGREDQSDMDTWRLTPEEWGRQIGMAYAALFWDDAQPGKEKGREGDTLRPSVGSLDGR